MGTGHISSTLEILLLSGESDSTGHVVQGCQAGQLAHMLMNVDHQASIPHMLCKFVYLGDHERTQETWHAVEHAQAHTHGFLPIQAVAHAWCVVCRALCERCACVRCGCAGSIAKGRSRGSLAYTVFNCVRCVCARCECAGSSARERQRLTRTHSLHASIMVHCHTTGQDERPHRRQRAS